MQQGGCGGYKGKTPWVTEYESKLLMVWQTAELPQCCQSYYNSDFKKLYYINTFNIYTSFWNLIGFFVSNFDCQCVTSFSVP